MGSSGLYLGVLGCGCVYLDGCEPVPGCSWVPDRWHRGQHIPVWASSGSHLPTRPCMIICILRAALPLRSWSCVNQGILGWLGTLMQTGHNPANKRGHNIRQTGLKSGLSHLEPVPFLAHGHESTIFSRCDTNKGAYGGLEQGLAQLSSQIHLGGQGLDQGRGRVRQREDEGTW